MYVYKYKSKITKQDSLNGLLNKLWEPLLFILIGLVFIFILMKITDRVCDKPFSKEYKQTQAYKNLQCPI